MKPAAQPALINTLMESGRRPLQAYRRRDSNLLARTLQENYCREQVLQAGRIWMTNAQTYKA